MSTGLEYDGILLRCQDPLVHQGDCSIVSFAGGWVGERKGSAFATAQTSGVNSTKLSVKFSACVSFDFLHRWVFRCTSYVIDVADLHVSLG